MRRRLPRSTGFCKAAGNDFGSDFHGANRQQVALGRGKGDLHVPMAMYEELNARHLQKAKEAEQ